MVSKEVVKKSHTPNAGISYGGIVIVYGTYTRIFEHFQLFQLLMRIL